VTPTLDNEAETLNRPSFEKDPLMDASQGRTLEFSPPPAQQESAWAFLAFAWRRKLLVVFGIVVALGLGYLHFLRQTPRYQSSAQILVVKQQASLPIQGVNVDTGYSAIHETLLRSPVIVSQAIEKHDLASLPSLRGPSSPVGTIIGGLGVSGSGSPTGDVIRFTYQSESRDDCPKVLEAIIEAYQDFLGDTYQSASQETADLISQAKDELNRQISTTEEEYRKFRYESPLLFDGTSALNIHESRLASIEAVRSSAVLENSKLQAQIDHIEAALKRGGNREALNLMVGNVQRSEVLGGGALGGGALGSGASVEDHIFPLLIEEQMLLENFGTDHPKIKAVRKRIELTREHLLGTRPGAPGEETPKDFYEIYLDSIREQILMNEQTKAEMTELFEKEREQARDLSTFQVTDSTYKAKIERQERLFDAVVKRLEEIDLVSEMSQGNRTKTEVIYPPGIGSQVAPDMKQILISAGLLGLVAGLALAFVVDSADRRFRGPDDIRNDLGLPVVGHIPVIPVSKKALKEAESDANADVLHPVLRLVHHPRGRIAEAYRAVRTALYFSTRGGGHKVIQVTSPNPGDGKSTLSANLAISIAQSGKKCILIDADFRRPRIHKLFGLDRDTGLSALIEGTAEIPDAVHETGVENLTVMTCGPRPENPSELLTSLRFQELLDKLRDEYEIVIIDTPPILAVTDPCNVAPRVDGVLLVMRLSTSARKASRRALETLDALGANVLGVVVNGVGGTPGYGGYDGAYGYGRGYGGYGYGGYGYGGYGGYGYGYGYGYGEKRGDGKGYYEDDTKANRERNGRPIVVPQDDRRGPEA
jgi:capsular exopolysaccharide synthesis family protein